MNAAEVTDTRQLLEASRLVDFVFYEESARREISDEAPSKGSIELKVAEVYAEEGFGMRVRFRLHMQSDDAEFIADIASEYEFDDIRIEDVDGAIRKDFIERVAFMATYPHLRASVFGAAGRLGLDRPVLAPVIQGSFKLNESSKGKRGYGTAAANPVL